MQLEKWDKMKSAVAECHAVDEIAQIRNQAEAYRYALKQARESPEVVKMAAEIKLRSERRAGELLKEIPREQGKRNDSTLSQGVTKLVSVLEENNITRQTASKWQKMANIPEEKFENYIEVQKELSTAGMLNYKKSLDRQERVETTETPRLDGIYRVIYADPPWQYNTDFMDKYGHAKSHYSTMSIDELCDLPVADIRADDCVLFMWTTSPKLEQAFQVIKAWGFNYKTSFVWDKVKHNFGYYNSVRHEFLLIAGHGSSTPDVKELHDSVISIERSGKHSEKPEYFRELIDKLYPTGNRVELFARKKVDGWETWGSEA